MVFVTLALVVLPPLCVAHVAPCSPAAAHLMSTANTTNTVSGPSVVRDTTPADFALTVVGLMPACTGGRSEDMADAA